jgi:ParB-like chromosome segregation protein Spo0J
MSKVQTIPIADLAPDPANVRRHGDRNREAIRASLRRFGAGRSIVLDGKNVVRAGNGTVAEAEAEGFDEVLVVEPKPNQLVAVRRPDWSPSEGTAYAIADNRAGDLADWDETALADQLRALQSEDFGLEAVGYVDAEVDALIAGLADKMVGDPDAAETPFEDFGAGMDGDGYTPFKFGDYSGRVGRDVYDSFVEAYKAKQEETAEPMLDDVLRAWLGV